MLEGRHPDRYPELTPPPPPPSGPPPRPARPETEARRLLRIGDPTGPESVEAAADALCTLTGGHHMHPFFVGLCREAIADPALADRYAAIIARGVDPKAGLPPGFRCPDHYVSQEVTRVRERLGLRPARAGRPGVSP